MFRPSLFPTIPFLAALAAALFLPASLDAAQLILRNGDRITGEVVSRENGRITFRSPLLGDITVAEVDAAIDELAGNQEDDNNTAMSESLAGLPPTQPTPEPTVTKPASTAAATPPPAIAHTPNAPPPGAPKASSPPPTDPARVASAQPARPSWKGKVEFGFKQQSGRNDRVDFDVRADAERKLGLNSYRGNGRILYGKANDRIISDRQEASFRWRRDFSKTVFSQSLTSYNSDVVKLIEHNYEQNFGFGYRLLDRKAHIINAGLGLTGQYRETTNALTDGFILGELFEDYTYKINGRFTLLQDFLAQVSTKASPNNPDAQNYKLRFNAALQGRVTTKLSLNLRFEYDFDNSVANRSARTDQRISSSLGYAF